ncbi:hypothetical protein OOK60_10735 [Trichothermofontia sichuanensis B231]|uniref:hypothetical protein n=1 Tax=Trichothermofontia sichuanensis TaxID=3045816 RepID=UPI00224737AD|nr:hypothetical protein [Trichothermofontia sichuanensis]UZQ52997.1 hypothetical protein OOK60_10735 [Trichothermofontia sichuanensis B231]
MQQQFDVQVQSRGILPSLTSRSGQAAFAISVLLESQPGLLYLRSVSSAQILSLVPLSQCGNWGMPASAIEYTFPRIRWLHLAAPQGPQPVMIPVRELLEWLHWLVHELSFHPEDLYPAILDTLRLNPVFMQSVNTVSDLSLAQMEQLFNRIPALSSLYGVDLEFWYFEITALLDESDSVERLPFRAIPGLILASLGAAACWVM